MREPNDHWVLFLKLILPCFCSETATATCSPIFSIVFKWCKIQALMVRCVFCPFELAVPLCLSRKVPEQNRPTVRVALVKNWGGRSQCYLVWEPVPQSEVFPGQAQRVCISGGGSNQWGERNRFQHSLTAPLTLLTSTSKGLIIHGSCWYSSSALILVVKDSRDNTQEFQTPIKLT